VPSCTARSVSRDMCPRHVSRARRYGLTAEDLAAVDAQVACDVCDEPARHVDHDHATGRVRGVLCLGCNTALGLVRESPERLRALARYLEAPEAPPPFSDR
jgi:hypothetical protein